MPEEINLVDSDNVAAVTLMNLFSENVPTQDWEPYFADGIKPDVIIEIKLNGKEIPLKTLKCGWEIREEEVEKRVQKKLEEILSGQPLLDELSKIVRNAEWEIKTKVGEILGKPIEWNPYE